jgi:hypothetical protein
VQNHEPTSPEPRTRIVQQIVARLLTLSDILETSPRHEWHALCAAESGRPFTDDLNAHIAAERAFADGLTTEQQTVWLDLDAARNTLQSVETHAAFALGRDCGAIEATRRPAIELFMDAAQAARRRPEGHHDEDHEILRSALDELRQALPAARSVLLTSRPLDSVSNQISEYVRGRMAGASKDDAPGVEQDAVYYLGLAMGLLLSEVL